MTKIDDGGQAFPRTWSESWGGQVASQSDDGMSLRDWFAGQMLPAAYVKAANGFSDYERCHFLKKKRDQLGGETQEEMAAALAYAIADAMLTERTKERSK